jgi:hypothetical protein
MKTYPESHFLINYCLQRPGTMLAILVVSFGLFISMDQTIIVDSCSKELLGDRGQNVSEIYTTTYIGWLPAHPEVFKFYFNAGTAVDQETAISLSKFRSFVETGTSFIERQMSLVERVIKILFR